MSTRGLRRAYKNALAIAIASFSSIALLSTGLAAFVIISGDEQGTTGNVVVSDVANSSIKITLDELPNGESRTLILDAAKGDADGRVQWDGTNHAVLTTTVSGTVEIGEPRTSNDVALSYYVLLKNASNSDLTDEAFQTIMGTRLTFNEGGVTGLGKDKSATITVTPDGADSKIGHFTFDFGFEWGSAYGGMNPSLFYDTTDGLEVETNDVVVEFNELKALFHGLTFEVRVVAGLK